MRLIYGFLIMILMSCTSKMLDEKIDYSTKTLSKEGCLGEECAKVNYSWPKVMNHVDSTLLNGLIEEKLESYIYSEDSTTKRADFGAQGFIDEYLEIKEEFPDMPGNWFINVESEITFDSLGLLSIQFYIDNYTGGAHANYSWSFVNYDFKSKKVLSNKELILDENKLLEKVESKFREFHEVGPNEDLNETGFFNIPESGFFLPEAIGYSGGNFKVVYNSYEIGPYALGPTELEIDLEELRGIIRLD